MTATFEAAATGRARPAGGRIVAIDLARGGAIVAMVVYHLAFDLDFFALVDWNVATAPGWRIFAAAIASTFLLLVGIGLVLAHGRGVRWGPFWRRFAVIALGAGAVSAATFVAMPQAPVYFGILHAIALFSLLGLPFVRAPMPVTLALALAVIALPFIYRSTAFDGFAFVWLGLAPFPPRTIDYEPLFPWFGVVLIGIAAARLTLARVSPRQVAAWRDDGRRRSALARGFAWCGRNSLVVYLLHQPVLFGSLYVAVALATPLPDREMRDFVTNCETTCSGNESAAFCRAYCACALQEIRERELWERLLANPADPDLRDRLEPIAPLCRSRVDPSQGARDG